MCRTLIHFLKTKKVEHQDIITVIDSVVYSLNYPSQAEREHSLDNLNFSRMVKSPFLTGVVSENDLFLFKQSLRGAATEIWDKYRYLDLDHLIGTHAGYHSLVLSSLTNRHLFISALPY
ncbi:MAG: hypothetical protein M0P09_00840 [Acholeplasmataceae bacterium]|nr:hypothetical protein [Acholeplasmataceae bacterium]